MSDSPLTTFQPVSTHRPRLPKQSRFGAREADRSESPRRDARPKVARLVLGILVIPIVLALAASDARAQGHKSDYERADRLRERARRQVVQVRVKPHWFSDGDRFWYRRDLPGGGREFVVVDAAKGTKAPAFDHERLAAALAKETGQEQNPARLPIDRIEPEDRAIRFRALGKGWRFETGDGTLAEHEFVEGIDPTPPRTGQDDGREGRRSRASDRSPDGEWRLSVKDHNLVLRK